MISCASCSRSLPSAAQNCPCGWEKSAASGPGTVTYGPKPKPAIWTGPTQAGESALREIIRQAKIGGNGKPSRKWAQRILDRVAAGETLSHRALEYANEVVNRRPIFGRTTPEQEAELAATRERMSAFDEPLQP